MLSVWRIDPMTEPIPDPPALLTPVGLKEFVKTSDAKAREMIDDAIGLAEVDAPCIAAPEFAHRRAAKAILRGAILRWIEASAGAAVTKNAGIYGQTVDTRQPRKAMFFPSEIDQLRKLCRGEDAGGGRVCDRPAAGRATVVCASTVRARPRHHLVIQRAVGPAWFDVAVLVVGVGSATRTRVPA